MKQVTALVLFLMLLGVFSAQAQQTKGAAAKSSRGRAGAKPDVVATQLSELKQALDAQQQQIRQLGEEIRGRDRQIQQLQERLDQSQTAASQAASKADAAASQASQQQDTVTALKNDVADLKTNSTNSALTLQETQKAIQEMGSPLAVHYKGVTITPGGYFAAESVWRQHALGADINTPFNSIPGAALNVINGQRTGANFDSATLPLPKAFTGAGPKSEVSVSDSTWLIAGALTAAECFPEEPQISRLAKKI